VEGETNLTNLTNPSICRSSVEGGIPRLPDEAGNHHNEGGNHANEAGNHPNERGIPRLRMSSINRVAGSARRAAPPLHTNLSSPPSSRAASHQRDVAGGPAPPTTRTVGSSAHQQPGSSAPRQPGSSAHRQPGSSANQQPQQLRPSSHRRHLFCCADGRRRGHSHHPFGPVRSAHAAARRKRSHTLIGAPDLISHNLIGAPERTPGHDEL
jgi:hypothetical protein